VAAVAVAVAAALVVRPVQTVGGVMRLSSSTPSSPFKALRFLLDVVAMVGAGAMVGAVV
jgi:hypothetical protein